MVEKKLKILLTIIIIIISLVTLCFLVINIYRNDLFDKTRLLSETFDYTKDEGLLSKENIKVNWFESEVQVIISKSIGSDKYQKVFTCEY